jgi:hypothetical protein
MNGLVFNAPPGWPRPPQGWVPPAGWKPDPSWPPAPPNWVFWVPAPVPAAPASPAGVATQPAGEPATEPVTSELPPAGPAVEDTTAFDSAQSDVSANAATGSAVEGSGRHAAVAPRDGADQQGADQADQSRSPAATEQDLPIPESTSSDNISQGLDDARNELEKLLGDIERAKTELVELSDSLVLQQVGIYEYHHPLEDAEAYRAQLQELQAAIKDAVRQRQAVLASDMFSYNNSLAAGRRMVSDFSRLMLRAYNAEADAARRSLRAGNVVTAKTRLDNTVDTIAKLGSMMQMRISPEYHELRIKELELTGDYLMKVQEEREAAREERERIREEERAQAELARQHEQLDKQQAHYQSALDVLIAQGRGDDEEATQIRDRIEEVQQAISANETRAANIRVGTVYVISNIGAFGPNVVKIGLTRRLDPTERIRELGDASVPFPFDLHAQFFSEDAVTLEAELHQAFADRRLNSVNLRREFFFATPAEVRDVMASKIGSLLNFTEQPEATQYFQSKAAWPTENQEPDAPIADESSRP